MFGNKVCQYYKHIDDNDVEWVMALFDEKAVYSRADSYFEGHDSIKRFFTTERKIRGVHTLDAVWAFDDKVICTGTFNGQGKTGDNRSVRFADYWFFNNKGLVIKRETFLALGQQYVKE